MPNAIYYAGHRAELIQAACDWAVKNRQKINAMQRERRSKLSSAALSIDRNRQKEYKLKNKDRIAARSREYIAANKQKAYSSRRHNTIQRKIKIEAQMIAKRYSKQIRDFYLSCPPGVPRRPHRTNSR